MRKLANVIVAVLLSSFLANGRAQERKHRPVLFPQIHHVSSGIHLALSADSQWLATSASYSTILWHLPTGKVVRSFKGEHAAISSSGKWIATVHGDYLENVSLWEASTGRLLHTLQGQAKSSVCEFSPDEERLVTASQDSTARVWDRASGKFLGTLEGHGDWVWKATWSRDGKWIATASTDRTARLWDAKTFKEVRRFLGNQLAIYHISFSGDGKWLATGGSDSSARVFEVATGKEKRQFGKVDTEFISGLNGVVINSDGSWIIYSHGGVAHFWELDGKKPLRTFGTGIKYQGIENITLSQDDKWLLTVSGLTIRVHETATGKLVKKFEPGTLMSHSVRLSEDGRTMVTGTWNLYIRNEFSARMWDLSKGKETRIFKNPETVDAIALSDDAKSLLIGEGSLVRLLDTATGKEVRSFPAYIFHNKTLVMSGDGKIAATQTVNNELRVTDLATGKDLHRWRRHSQAITVMAMSRDGKRLASSGFDKSIRIWDPAKGEQVSVAMVEGTPDALALSDDGKWLIAAHQNGQVEVRDADSGAVIRSFPKKDQDAYSFKVVAVTRDKKIVAAGGYGNSIRLWDAETGKVRGELVGHVGPVDGLAFFPDGKRLVSTSADQSSRFWDVAGGKELCRSYSFSDGTWAVLDAAGRYDAANDGDVKGLLWVVGTETFPLRQHRELGYDPGLLAKHLGFSQEPLRKMGD